MYFKLMQFSAILLMASLTLKLLVMPSRVISDSRVNKSRWLLTAGALLLGVQFLLQYILGWRVTNVEAAVKLNLAFFIPCSALYCLSVINLQRRGFLSRQERYLVIPVWILSMALSFWSLIAASIPYAAMQIYYVVRQMRYMRLIRRAMANYFDSDYNELLLWMQWAIYIMGTMAIMVPLMIFAGQPWLAVFAILFLMAIFYLVDCFCLYAVSNAPAQVVEAQQNEEEVLNEEAEDLQQKSEERVSDTALHRVELAVGSWIDRRGHLQAGLNLPNAAEAIGVPRYLLSAWLKEKGERYNDWLTALRIDEAKRVMQNHPDWSNETIAQHCGFSDRTYFQRKFKQITGLTPSDYQMQ